MKKNTNALIPNPCISLHEQTTSYDVVSPSQHQFPRILKRVLYKEYPRFPRYALPEVAPNEIDYFKLLFKRRSRREFRKGHPTKKELSTTLFFSAGVNPTTFSENRENRFYPSAGARFPIETYIINTRNPHYPLGTYHYHIKSHALELLPSIYSFSPEELWGKANTLLLSAPLYVVFTAVFNRSSIKYGSRAYRYALIESGHMMQNMYITCEALQLRCCAIGGFSDTSLVKQLQLEPHKEQAIYACALG